MNKAPDFSVVIPFYNEQGNIHPLFDELIPVLKGMGRPYEILAVNDGSQDATEVELVEAQNKYDGLRLVHFVKNAGQTAAFAAGFERARGRYVITMDGDLQIDPNDIPKMVERLERGDVDLVYGWRKNRADSRMKKISTKVGNGVRNWLTKDQIADTGCPLKIFKREVVQRMKLLNGMHRFFITLAHMDGYRSAEVVVHHRHRHEGVSKYGVGNRALRGLRDCLAIRWMMQRRFEFAVREEPAENVAVPPENSRAAEAE